MSYFSDASLVYIPAAVKNGKTYSVKPTDGSGDLTFSRASNATRVGPNGLIEKVRTNLALQSEALNTTWTDFGTGTTVTANATTAPDGTSTADLVQFPSATSPTQYVLGQSLTLTTGVPYTISFYAKTQTGTVSNLVVRLNATEVALGETITTTWQRFTKTLTPLTASSDSGFKNRPAVSGDGTAIDVYIWGVQIEIGDIATDYIATTTAAVSVGPVSGLPRLDYLNSSCPRLLLEPQRTNLFTFSESFDNAAWTKQDATITANNAISPSGYQDADLYTTSSDTFDFVRQTKSFTSGTAYTISVFAKAGTSNEISLTFQSSAFGAAGANFNLSTLAITTAGTTTGKIEDYGNGWYRCSATATATATANASTGFASPAAGAVTTLYLWGAQLEAGAYETSLIPTLSTSVTRVAESASKTGISSLIGQSEGTLYLEFSTQPEGDSNARISISDGTTNNWVFLSKEGPYYRAYVKGSGSVAYSNVSEEILDSGIVKMAIAYKNNDIAYYFNGTQRLSSNSISFSGTLGSLIFGNNFAIGDVEESIKISQALLFPTRLSNADLAALTA